MNNKSIQSTYFHNYCQTKTGSYEGKSLIKIAIGSDHAAYDYKEKIIKVLRKDYDVIDYGMFEKDSIKDYSIAEKVALSVSSGKTPKGILLCGTGIGMSISANKIPGAIAALCHDIYTAKCSREHNDSNILVMGSRVISLELAIDMVKIWLHTPFEGGRHIPRNDSFKEFDEKYRK